MIPKDRNIAIKISNEKEFCYLKKIFNSYKALSNNFRDYAGGKIIWMYIDLNSKIIYYNSGFMNPIESYPEYNYLILDIKQLMREEKLKRIQ